MSQQVNLCNRALLPVKDWLTARNTLVAAVALVVLLSAWMGIQTYRLHRETARAQTSAGELAKQRAILDTLSKQVADARNNPVLIHARDELQGRVDDRKQILDTLAKGSPEEGKGFSDYFRGLAKRTVSGLWLTGFTVGAGGSGIEIRGRMTDQSVLADYIRRLEQEEVFKNIQFSALEVSTPEDGDGKKDTGNDASAAAKTGAPANYLEFVLKPVAGAPAGGDAKGSTAGSPAAPAPGAGGKS